MPTKHYTNLFVQDAIVTAGLSKPKTDRILPAALYAYLGSIYDNVDAYQEVQGKNKNKNWFVQNWESA